MTNQRERLDSAICYYTTTDGDASMARMLSNHGVDAWPDAYCQDEDPGLSTQWLDYPESDAGGL